MKQRVSQTLAVTVVFLVFGKGGAEEPLSPQRDSSPEVRRIMHGINVKDLGAVGDGRHDDTQAFKDAIEMTGKVEPEDEAFFDPKSILVPPGHYRITETLPLTYGPEATSGANRGIKVLGTTGPARLWGELGPTGNPGLYTELFWDGTQGKIMFDCSGMGEMEFSNLLLNGRNKTSALISINSPRHAGSAGHVFRNVRMINSDVGFECGNASYICSSDMSFYDVTWIDCKTGFRTLSEQNLNYNFIRCGALNTGVAFDFQKGGSAVFTLPFTHSVGTFLRVGSGGINGGTFTVNGCRLDGCRYRGDRTVVLRAQGETNVVFTGLLTTCTGLWPRKNKDGTNGPIPENTPIFVLGPHANVLVQGSMISGNIARLTGNENRVPTWIQFDNCRFRVRSDPRTMIETDDASGYELRNCVITTDRGENIMVSKRKAPVQEVEK